MKSVTTERKNDFRKLLETLREINSLSIGNFLEHGVELAQEMAVDRRRSERIRRRYSSDRWHNYFNRARPFVSLSGMSRSSTSPRVLLGGVARTRLALWLARTHTVHPFSALPAKEEKKRGDKGLTYRSVTRYPTNDSFFFFFSFSPV